MHKGSVNTEKRNKINNKPITEKNNTVTQLWFAKKRKKKKEKKTKNIAKKKKNYTRTFETRIKKYNNRKIQGHHDSRRKGKRRKITINSKNNKEKINNHTEKVFELNRSSDLVNKGC